MSAHKTLANPAVPTGQRVLYQVAHLSDMDLDRWTQDFDEALSICAQLVRDYGGVHLHSFALQTGQYEGECLLRMGAGATA